MRIFQICASIKLCPRRLFDLSSRKGRYSRAKYRSKKKYQVTISLQTPIGNERGITARTKLHFLHIMQVRQLSPGICHVKMYGKRDSMPALASIRKFPHIETTVSTSCKYAVLHSQLCRYAYRCTRRDYFVDAASKLMRDMWLHGYDMKFLRCILYTFQGSSR